jgi:hypothetical protein
VPYYLETPAYTPARPSQYPSVAAWETRRRVVEWGFLERLLCMPAAEWREDAEVAAYRRERERCEMAIRNLLRGEMPGVVDAGAVFQAGFREVRREARVRAAKVRWVREKRSEEWDEEGQRTPTKRRNGDHHAVLEAGRSSPASFTTRGGYSMRRRVKID